MYLIYENDIILYRLFRFNIKSCRLGNKVEISVCINSRGITFLSIPSNVFCRLILNRIRMAVDQKIRGELAGFRAGRGCSDQIFALRNIVEQCIEPKFHSMHCSKMLFRTFPIQTSIKRYLLRCIGHIQNDNCWFRPMEKPPLSGTHPFL